MSIRKPITLVGVAYKEKSKLEITSLNSHFPTLNFNTKYWEEKSGAKNSVFSKLKPTYCNLVSRVKVWTKVCNIPSALCSSFCWSQDRSSFHTKWEAQSRQNCSDKKLAVLLGHLEKANGYTIKISMIVTIVELQSDHLCSCQDGIVVLGYINGQFKRMIRVREIWN